MATYLQNVTDYIPQFQPFQPDFNFYANALGTKQSQYDSNFKQLNNVYGRYLNADLTRDDNVTKKQELFKAIDFDLKRVSGLDLSLEENVAQATQVFKPFYEDQYLMKDMAFTKTYKTNRANAEGLKNARDTELRKDYWGSGVKAMDYMAEEFKEADLESTLGFRNPTYTPYVNVIDKAQQVVKDANLSVDDVQFSPDGKWIVKTKNGQALIPTLNKLLEASLGGDPAVQDLYKTQAYVNRKDYAYSNAAQFGGDKKAAEMKYLQDSYTILKESNNRKYDVLRNENIVYDSQIAKIEKEIASGNKLPGLKIKLEQYKQAQEVNGKILAKVEDTKNTLSEGSATLTTDSGFENPYGDIESLRWKVDNGMASSLMRKDLSEAANIFAYTNSSTDIEANPYKVKEIDHQYRMIETSLANQGKKEAALIRNKGESDAAVTKWKLENGHTLDDRPYLTDAEGKVIVNPKTGAPALNPTYNTAIPIGGVNNTFVKPVTSGNSTGEVNIKRYTLDTKNDVYNNTVAPAASQILLDIQTLRGRKLITDADVTNMLGMSYQQYETMVSKGHKMTSAEIDKMKTGYRKLTANLIEANPEVAKLIQDSESKIDLMDSYSIYTKEVENFVESSSKKVISEMERTLPEDLRPYAKYLYDDNGNIRSKDTFYKLIGADKRPADKGRLMPNVGGGLGLGEDILDPGTTGRQAEAVSYNELAKAADQIYKKSALWKDAPIGSASFNNVESGTGITVRGAQTVNVFPTLMSSLGVAYYQETMNELQSFDLSDSSTFKYSINGLGKSEDKDKDKDNENKFDAIPLINKIIAESYSSSSELKGFTMGAIPIAEGDYKKEAMIFNPNDEWLKEQVYSYDKDGNPKGDGIISPEEYELITKNGLAIITDDGVFNNGLMKTFNNDMIKSVVDNQPDGFNYESPYSLNPNQKDEFTINKNNVSGGYDLAYTYSIFNPETEDFLVMSEELVNQLPANSNLTDYKTYLMNEIFIPSYKNNIQNGRK
jgi:D-ribose pyranose/furanose isomerase RbsD